MGASPLRALRESLASVGWERASTRLGAALLVVSAIFFAANFAEKAWLSYQFAQVKAARLAQIAAAEAQISQLHHDLAYLHSRPFYVQEARRYSYVQPGDIPLEISVLPAADSAPPPAPAPVAHTRTPQHESWLRRILQAIVPGI